MATTFYCAITDVQNVLSANGVTFRTDDTPPTTNGDVLDEASREVDWYCLLSYDETQLAASPTVKHWCRYLAARNLCERRGNPVPGSLAKAIARIEEKMKQVGSGARKIPDIPQRRTGVPVLSNVRIRLDPFPRTVVENNRSTGPAREQNEHADTLDWFDYSI